MELLNYTILTLFGYKLSLVEFVGVIFGFWSVLLASKQNIHTWTTGLINIIAFFIIFYQSKLYSSMLLQVFFLIMSIYGWINWNKKDDTKISSIYIYPQIIIMGIFIFWLGYNMKKFNPAYPYTDASIIIFSILATYMMTKKILECWILWFIVDIICIILYAVKGLYFISLEYTIFLLLVVKAYTDWGTLFLKELQEKEGEQ